MDELGAAVEIERLVELLASPDEETRQDAARVLDALGPAAVPALVAALLDESLPVDWGVAAGALRRIGIPAFAAVRDAFAAASSAAAEHRAGWTFAQFGPEAIPLYIEALRHPSPRVRARAAARLGSMGEAAQPGPALVELLGDHHGDVQQAAVRALRKLGPGLVGLLEQARRSPSKITRWRALQALREIVGDDGLGRHDQALLARLVRWRLRHDQPLPFGETSWLAVPGGDQAGILALLDLSPARPATFAMGLAAALRDWQAQDAGSPQPEHPELTRVFVTPELSGWTLIVGNWWAASQIRPASAIDADCRRLSTRYETAQAYTVDVYSDACEWRLAAAGQLHRKYSWEGKVLVDEGEPPACERTARSRNPGESIVVATYDLAASCSISPQDLGPETPMRGHGLLARTPYGRLHGEPRRALPV